MLNKFKLSTRIMTLGVVIVVAFVLVLAWIYPKFKSKLYEAKYIKTQHLVESAWNVVEHYGKLAKSGAMKVESLRPSRQLC